MAFGLSFSPEFYVDEDDAEFGAEQAPTDKPTTVFKALLNMTDEAFCDAAAEVGLDPHSADIDDLMATVRETDTCRDLRSPVEVWIDPHGLHTILVYDKSRAE